MTKKILLAFTTLALGAAIAGESYRITLFQPSTINGTTLKPGDYRLELKDNKAVIKAGKETVEADVRVESADQKFPSTSVRYTNGNGQYKVEEIRLGGTKTKVIFGAAETRPASE